MAFDKIVGVDGTTYQFPSLVRNRIAANIESVGSVENLATIAALGPALAGKSSTSHNHTLASLTSNGIDELGDVAIGFDGGAGIALQDKHTLQYESSTSKWRNKVASGGVTVSDAPPSTPILGDAWFDSNDGTLYVYYSDGNTVQWVQVQANSALETSILSRLTSIESYVTTAQQTPQYSPNYVINGGFDILQRAQSVNITGSHFTYKTADRWILSVAASGATNIDNGIIAFPDGGEAIDGIDVPYFMRWTVNSVGTATAYGMINRMEDVRTMAGDTVTLSFYVKGTQTSTIRPVLIQYFGTGGSADVTITPNTTTTTTFNSTWTRKSFTFDVPSIAAKTIGSGSFIQVQIDALSISTGTMNIAAVQLEQGSTPTPFRRSGETLQGELAACQRYYYANGGSYAAYNIFNSGNCQTGSWYFPVEMRANPTITVWDGAGTINKVTIANAGGSSQNAITPPATLGITRQNFQYIAGGLGGTTGNNGMMLLSAFTASAEL